MSSGQDMAGELYGPKTLESWVSFNHPCNRAEKHNLQKVFDAFADRQIKASNGSSELTTFKEVFACLESQ